MASTSSSPPPENIPNWVDLPPEVTAKILNLLGPMKILNTARKVCVTWRRICNDRSMWKSMAIPFDIGYTRNTEMMCRRAVDLRCGLLDHITMTFGTKELLHYVADRYINSCHFWCWSPHLRSLRLEPCFILSEKDAGGEVARNLPNLEELQMFFPLIAAYKLGRRIDILVSFGRFCPQLKSLTYNIHGPLIPYEEDEADCFPLIQADEEALAIAQTMPRLRHLSLFGNQMTNKGLQAILKGCPHLESLDLRQCLNVDLSGDAGSICAKRIKNFKRPNDSMDGYEFNAEITNGFLGIFI